MFDENTPGAKEELFAWLHHMNTCKGSRPFHYHQFPASHESGRQNYATEWWAVECLENVWKSLFDYVFQTNRKFSSTNECNFAVGLPDTSRFRVNTMVQRGATALVFAPLPANIPKFETLICPYSERHRPPKTRPDYFCQWYRFGQVHFSPPYRLSTKTASTTLSPSKTRLSLSTNTKTASSPNEKSA